MPLTLPSACAGCPFESKSRYFTPDTYVPGAKVMFLGQNPGDDEEMGHKLVSREWRFGHKHDTFELVPPQPLIGATGQLFTERFLPLSGLARADVSLGNVIRCRPGRALGGKPNDLPPITTTMKLETSDAPVVKAMKHCQAAYFRPPASTEVVVTMGRHAMFAMTGIQNEDNEYGRKAGVMESWRGYGVDVPDFGTMQTIDTSRYHPLDSRKRIFFTMHLAALYQGDLDSSSDGSQGQGMKKYHHACLEDFHRLKLLLAGKWPEALPSWSEAPPTVWPTYSAFDTEYVPETNQLLRWSLCDTDNHLWAVEYNADTARGMPLEPGATVLAQNWIADYHHFRTLVGDLPVTLEDMFLAHTVLWTGEPHNLNYIQSKYGTLNRYKHLISVEGQEALYSALDAHQPMTMWRRSFLPQFREDLQSWKVYKTYRTALIEPYARAEASGSRVDTARLADVKALIGERLAQYQADARRLTGDDTLNLGGRKAMLTHIYGGAR